MGCSFYSLL